MAHLDNHSSTIKGKENVISGSSSEGPVNVCIFRVPYPIRSCEEKAYAPSVVSLGPYGYGSNCTMKKHKHVAVVRTAKRINMKQDILIKEINKLHGKARQYYEEEDIKWDAKMMTYDACFILEFFKCAANKRGDSDKGSSIFVFQNKGYKNSLYSAISVDIMKLENQVPLFILVEILKLEFQDKAITKLADILSQSRTFRGFPFYPLDKDVDAKENLEKHIRNGACHLLDLHRMVIEGRLTTSSQESNNASPHGNAQIPESSDDTRSISQAVSFKDERHTPCAEKSWNAGCEFKSKSHTPSAEKLKNAGIKFEPGKIGFKKNSFLISTLSLPAITLKYRTETLLRNLMAYEECQRCSFGAKKTVTSKYVHLLDSLIDSEKDVSVLRDSKVILSFVGSDEVVARMFNNLEIGITVENPDDPVANPSDSESIDENDGHVAVTINPSEKIKDPETIDENDGHLAVTINHSEQIDEYGNAMTELRNHYNQKWNLWIGQLREEHFSNPWYVISLLAATALLIMTLIQTMYAVK